MGEWWCNKELYCLFKIVKKKIVFTRVNFIFLNRIINPLINFIPRVYGGFFANIFPASIIVYILEVRKDKKFKDYKLNYLEKMERNKDIDNYNFVKNI